MGETEEDRIGLLMSYMEMETPPESIPINALVAVDGTPLEDQKPIEQWELIRMVATTRIAFPESVVRLSAGRTKMNMEAQAMCFMAGAGSIFAGDKLLTTPNPEYNEDQEMFTILGLIPKESFADGPQPETKPDEVLLEKKRQKQERLKELEKKRALSKGKKFEPRKMKSVDSL
jgi:biotin synthase